MTALRTRRRLRSPSTAVVAAVLGATTLAGCGVGRDAQTYQERRNADSTNTSAGKISLDNLSILAPEEEGRYEAGADAEAVVILTSRAREDDRLVAVTSPAAQEVVILDEQGEEGGQIEVPGLVGARTEVTLLLKGLTAPVRSGEYLSMTFRFADNGSAQVLVPVGLTGSTDRPVYTKEEGSGEGEPALQAPTGGHGEKEPSAE